MKNITGKRQGLQWTLTTILDDLYYTDGLGLFSNRHQDIQQETKLLSEAANKIELNVKTKKSLMSDH